MFAAYDNNQEVSSLLLLISYMSEGDPSKSPPTPIPSQFQPAHFQSQPLT
jgi:hypothetical protein